MEGKAEMLSFSLCMLCMCTMRYCPHGEMVAHTNDMQIWPRLVERVGVGREGERQRFCRHTRNRMAGDGWRGGNDYSHLIVVA
jgi:hypothetical protein